MAFGSKMWNPHTGGLIDGLGLVPIVTLPHFRAASIDRAKTLRSQLDRSHTPVRHCRAHVGHLERIDLDMLGAGRGGGVYG